ncbi:MAG: tannase/feruloyl esterase family alpha/beta hydrolase [Hyphomonadaceae bacterium]|nr:tannase/feruloyl esterase family alpha/beta hydrolase [Hyphomonadaceae bacterium]
MIFRSLRCSVTLLACAAALSACTSVPPPLILTAASCTALSGTTIAATDIGLPTNGARVTAAEFVAANAEGAPEHCLVSADIDPVDQTAPDIQMHIALPTNWNGNALMHGGGGLDGFIPDVTGNQPISRLARAPLARGYAVFGSDGGHQGPSPAFAANRESYLNYLGEALKKTHDVSLAIIIRTYGRDPERSYFMGSSRGGAEGLAVAARWPDDWDGVVSLYPARSGESALMMFGMLVREQVLAAPGAWLSPQDRGLLFDAALERCDTLDGAEDGVISNIRECRAVFDPAAARLRGAPLRCEGGADLGDNCLSDAQIRAIRLIDQPARSTFPEATGDAAFPGYNILTSDSGRPSAYGTPGFVSFGLGANEPGLPFRPGMSLSTFFTQAYFQAFLGLGPSFDPYALDLDNPPEAIRARFAEIARLDTADTDLTGFAARGGKLILIHGTDDMLISPRWSEHFYANARQRLGEGRTQSTIRYYEIPGYSHGSSDVFDASFDTLTALANWVERGVDPAEREVVADPSDDTTRTRPLCLYPRFARYGGSGDMNSAASFVCAER